MCGDRKALFTLCGHTRAKFVWCPNVKTKPNGDGQVKCGSNLPPKPYEVTFDGKKCGPCIRKEMEEQDPDPLYDPSLGKY